MACKTAIAAAMLLALAGCGASTRHASGGPYYFKTFASYNMPLQPVGELSASDAKELETKGNAFYSAWFNEQGQILHVEKHYRGAIVMRIEYTYRDGRLIEGSGINPDGKKFVQSFADREP